MTHNLVLATTGGCYLDDQRQRTYVVNGWNVTGDSYRIDKDGCLWFVARADDMIVSVGYNIAGPEVEADLLLNRAVSECAVGASPDEARGHLVQAFIVLSPGHEPDSMLVAAIHLGGLAGLDLDEIAIGLHEIADEQYLRYRVRTNEYIGEKLTALGVHIVQSVGGHIFFVDARRFCRTLRRCSIRGRLGGRAVRTGWHSRLRNWQGHVWSEIGWHRRAS